MYRRIRALQENKEAAKKDGDEEEEEEERGWWAWRTEKGMVP